MDPIDAEVRETDKQRELKIIVESEWSVRRSIVELSVAAYFSEETGRGEYCHNWHRDHCLPYLKLDLVFEVLGMGESGMVEDEEVG